jgi:hypothetical protein
MPKPRRDTGGTLEERVLDKVSTADHRPNRFALAFPRRSFVETFPTPEERECFRRLFPGAESNFPKRVRSKKGDDDGPRTIK